MPKAGEPVVIYRAANSQQANLLRNLLEEQGIAAWVQNDMIQSAAGDLPLGWRGDSQVVVRDADAERARRMALQFEEQLRAESASLSADDPEIYAATDTWDNWPKCSECGERRHTRCPLCGLAGDRFPLVDLDLSDDRERVLLMCQPCDEPFRPQFYRLCHRCGHDFGSGIRLEVPETESKDSATDDRSKIWIVLAMMAVLGGALATYFVLLLRR